MTQMVRKQVTISARTRAAIKRLAHKTGKTEAEILRQAIEQQVQQSQTIRVPRDAVAWREAREFIESLIAQGPVSGGRTWTREELYKEC